MYKNNNIAIGKRLKQFRKSRNIKQTEIATTLHTSSGYISEVESDKKIPGSNFIVALEKAYNINPNWLLTGKGEMFMSDIDNDNISMPIEFINKLRKDLKDKGDNFYDSLSISKDRMFDVLLGRTKLRRVEIIELARKLNESLDDYMYLADYVPKEFVRVLKNPKMIESLRTAGQLTDQEIDQAITAFTNVLKEFAKKHNLK